MNGQVLDKVIVEKDLGIMISSDVLQHVKRPLVTRNNG